MRTSDVLDHAAERAVNFELPAVYRPVRIYFLVEALASHAAVLLLNCIFYFTHQQFHWGVRQNLMLACGQGMFYVAGAMSAGRISGWLGRRNLLMGLQLMLSLLALQAFLFPSPLIVTLVLLAYTSLIALAWPALESLVSEGAGGEALSKRLAMYNLMWSGTNAVTLAVSGAIIQRWPSAVFALAAVAHLAAVVILRFDPAPLKTDGASAAAHLEPEPELRQMRKQALWLSRIALPSTYVVVYSLSAMLPSLPVMQPLSTQWRTIVGSVWFAARFGTFILLGATRFWHTRPKLMLVAAAVMLLAFLGVTVRPSEMFGGAGLPRSIDVLSMVTWQILLGAAMGIIYSASLYFGMVLSEGSTEHGGYHEALIGVGSILGPGCAVIADVFYPGVLGAGIVAVTGLIGLSLVGAVAAAVVAGRREST